jgi:predicted phage terminase large subunit-like protein
MKSRLVSVFYNAWVWTFAPEKKFLYSSYSEVRSMEDALDARNLIQSEWYQTHWPLKLDETANTKGRYRNLKGGYRISTGVGGAGTGDGGDYVICDDPLKAQDAESEINRNEVNNWWNQTMSTRLNSPKFGVRIVVMQRLHADDLTGFLLEKKEVQYEHLCLPMEYDGERFVSSIGFKDPRKQIGELLWPVRFGKDEVKKLKGELGEMGTAGQLQQRPAPLQGYYFYKKWFEKRYFDEDLEKVATILSFDTASATGKQSAFSSCCVFELTSDYRLFLTEVDRRKVEFTDLTHWAKELINKYKQNLYYVIIENKSSGIQLLQVLSEASDESISEFLVSYVPKGEKVERAKVASLWCENGSVILPFPSETRPWLFDFEKEMFEFPNSKYKDQIDSFSQGVEYMINFLSQGYHARNGG